MGGDVVEVILHDVEQETPDMLQWGRAQPATH